MNSEDDGQLSPFERKLKERLASKAGQTPPAVPSTQSAPTAPVVQPSSKVRPEDIPEVDLGISQEELALDEAIRGIDILEAYRRWCGKMTPKVHGNQRESIMISCPNPAHPDKNPSAWISLDKQTYFCSGCQVGGDKYDIAAMSYGYSVPGYRSKGNPEFHAVTRMMAMDLGFTFVKSITGGSVAVPPGSGQEDPAEAPGSEDPAAPPVEVPAQDEVHAGTDELRSASVPVGKLPSAVAREQAEKEHASNQRGVSLDWRKIVPKNTFLHEYIEACSVDTSPEEYHFWTGLMAIGFAIGRNKQLLDLRSVTGNLFVCLVGPSGAGKSRATHHLDTLLMTALPFDESTYTGVDVIKQPGSGEYLVGAFEAIEEDPSNPGSTIQYPIRGLVNFDEMATLMKVAGRSGSTLGTQLMELYDAPERMGTGSRTGGKRRAHQPFGQCLSTTQNESLSRLMDKDDDFSGFMNRWVFASGSLKRRLSMGGEEVVLDYPAELLHSIYMWAFTSSKLEMEPAAQQRWDQFFHDTLVPLQDASEKKGSALLGRMDLLMKKLFLLFSANLQMNKVPLIAVEQAIKVFHYLVESYGLVDEQLRRTVGKDIEEKIMDAVEKLATANPTKPPTSREIYHAVKRYVEDVKQLENFLKPLVNIGMLVEVPPAPTGKRGRPRGMQYAVGN